MNDPFKVHDRYNTQVLGKSGEGMGLSTSHVADKFLQGRKVNSGHPLPPKPAAPWYRRFDKRSKP